MKHSWIFFIATLFFTLHTPAQISIEDELFASVLSIENRTHQSRNEFIKEQVRAMNLGFIAAPFKQESTKEKEKIVIEGENIIVRIGNGTKRIVVGAHYDASALSPGANDNGGGVAVLLALIKRMQDVEWNYIVDFCFFDQEEEGYMGSFSYVKQFVVPKHHLIMINLDVVGTGDEVFVGPVGKNNRSIMRYVNEAAKTTGFPFTASADYPGSDHEAFAQFNLQNISISVVPKGDAEKLSKFVQNGYKADSLNTPQVLGVMHTLNDKSKFVSPVSLKMSYEFTKTLLMLLNESGR